MMVARSRPAMSFAAATGASLNIIIPMGGSGEAFKAAGFKQAMIKIAGRAMLLHLLDQLKLRLGDVVWLIIPSSVYMQFKSQLDFKAEYPQADIRVCEFTVLTRGDRDHLHRAAADDERGAVAPCARAGLR